MKKVLFIKNAAVLTGTSLLLRMIGIFFRVWLAGSIGAEGMGLYQVIFSVYLLASTFATSGISTAVTRMVTERLSVGDGEGAKKILRISITLSIIIAVATSAIIIAFAEPIGIHLVGDVRSVMGLKTLCLGLPFMGVCSCLRGYFLARRSAIPPSVCQLVEQVVRMSAIVVLIKRFSHRGIIFTSAAVLFGDAVGEAVSTVVLYILYKVNVRRLVQRAVSPLKGAAAFKELARISAPITAGRYLHTGLRTAENLLTPTCLLRYSASKSFALEQFGMIKGMTLPLLLFPASLLSAISTLLVPEITENAVTGNSLGIKYAVEKIFYITAVVSFLISGIFFTAAYPIGMTVYKSGSVGYLIRALSPLIPFMYIDLIADGILKGLDKQGFLFRCNVIDSAARVLLVLFFVPKFGMVGFLGVMFFSNLFTSVLSVIKIVKTANIKFNMQKYFLKPLFAACAASAVVDIACKSLYNSYILYTIITSIGVFILYFVFLTIFGGINISNIYSKIALFFTKKGPTV